MPRILEMKLELTDDEFAAFMQRASGNSASPVHMSISGAPVGGASADDDDDTTPNTAAPQVDKNGTPWIEAVHAATKGLNKDGTWKRRKGVDEATMKLAEAQARTALGTFTVPASITGTGAPVSLPNPVPAGGIPGFGGAPAGIPGFPPIVPQQPVPAPVSYEDISNKFAALAQAGKVPGNDQLTHLYQSLGITDMNVLMTDETIRRRLMDALNTLG